MCVCVCACVLVCGHIFYARVYACIYVHVCDHVIVPCEESYVDHWLLPQCNCDGDEPLEP